ncbi:MAG: TetR/AcrR family transcriptional regulator [Desulfuromonadales bacterium]|nr:TetR/AcrR family transcriptional regulator [Desulfuromonadales bacterium]
MQHVKAPISPPGRLKVRTIDPENKARCVLESARQLFVRKGYHRVSVPDIVQDSGVSTGAIYNLFGSKENLAATVQAETMKDFHAMFLERLRDRESTYDKLHAFAEIVFEVTEKDPTRMEYLLFMRHADFLEDMPPVCLTEPFRLVRQIVTEGMSRGEVKQGDFFVSAVSFTGIILRAAQLNLQCVLPRPLSELSAEFIQNAWDAIKA